MPVSAQSEHELRNELMLGWQIFVHALRMVFGNFKQVLQITIGPALIATVVFALLLMNVDTAEIFDEGSGQDGLPPGFLPLFFAGFVVGFAVFAWIAVAWHRFILLEEYPSGILPKFTLDRILAYVGRVLILFLVTIAAMIPLSVVFMALAQIGVLGLLVLVAAYLGFVVCLMRLSIILPAAAIGKPVTLGEAWANSAGSSSSIFVLVVLSVLFQVMVQFVIGVFAVIPALGFVVSLFLSMLIIPMFNVSVLTTLYGIFIEKRELS